MSKDHEVLIAIINSKHDVASVLTNHRYRIPVAAANKQLKDRWLPEWLAFYQTKVFGEAAYAVNGTSLVVRSIDTRI